MARDSRKAVEEEGLAWGPDTIEAEIRPRIRGMSESIVVEELEAALGAGQGHSSRGQPWSALALKLRFAWEVSVQHFKRAAQYQAPREMKMRLAA